MLELVFPLYGELEQLFRFIHKVWPLLSTDDTTEWNKRERKVYRGERTVEQKTLHLYVEREREPE